MNDYYRAMSNNQISITGDILNDEDRELGEIESVLTPLPGVKRLLPVSEGQSSSGVPSPVEPITVKIFCEGDIREAVYRRIQKEDWIMMEFLRERKSLENIFRELTISE